MSSGVNGMSAPAGSSLCCASRTLIKVTSIVYLPALRSARTRLTVSVALPVETSTAMPYFFEKPSTTGRYCREGAPPEAIITLPSRFAAAMSLDHSSSKAAEATGFSAACAIMAFGSTETPSNARNDKSKTTNIVRPPISYTVVEPVGRPGAVSVGSELEPHFAAFLHGTVPLAVYHDIALSIALHLILDTLADEKRRARGPGDHP